MEDLGWLTLLSLLPRLGPTLVGLMFSGAWFYVAWLGHRVTGARGFRLLLIGSAIQLALSVLFVAPEYLLHARMMRGGPAMTTIALWMSVINGVQFLGRTLASGISIAGVVSIIHQMGPRKAT